MKWADVGTGSSGMMLNAEAVWTVASSWAQFHCLIPCSLPLEEENNILISLTCHCQSFAVDNRKKMWHTKNITLSHCINIIGGTTPDFLELLIDINCRLRMSLI